MRKFFYLRLALSNIRRSRKFYFPYMLACTFTIAMFYIVCAISVGHALDGVSGADVLKSYTIIGAFVVAIFAAIFLFYTNSFLTKRRRREFGLYNILGMERRHIARVMLDETLLVALVTLGAGIAGGLGLAKLVALIAVKLVRGQAAFGMEFVPAAAQATLIAFAVIYALSYLVELARMARSSTLDLLNSAQQGEREPKTRWLMALIGLACLGGGYWIAITTQDVLTAVAVFFLAVILVIAGTYLLFIAGSIAVLKMLRANRRYYYKPNHFISVSGMIYRMKQNAAGLATICILSTMVLVMLSSTVSLGIGTEDSIAERYPREISFEDNGAIEDSDARGRAIIESSLAAHGVAPENYVSYRAITFAAARGERAFILDDAQSEFYNNSLTSVTVMPYEDYLAFAASGDAPMPGADEVLAWGAVPEGGVLDVGSLSFRIAARIEGDFACTPSAYMFADAAVLVVRDMQVLERIAREQEAIYGPAASEVARVFAFDIPLEGEALVAAGDDVVAALRAAYSESYTERRYAGRESQYLMSGGLMFLGVFLGLLFVMAMVLMMYYKQISEGYDDRARYAIMRSVGLDDREIRRSINSQGPDGILPAADRRLRAHGRSVLHRAARDDGLWIDGRQAADDLHGRVDALLLGLLRRHLFRHRPRLLPHRQWDCVPLNPRFKGIDPLENPPSSGDAVPRTPCQRDQSLWNPFPALRAGLERCAVLPWAAEGRPRR